jgi:transformation/transcription domain-associated protein
MLSHLVVQIGKSACKHLGKVSSKVPAHTLTRILPLAGHPDLSVLKREMEIINEAEIVEFLSNFMPWTLNQLSSAGAEKSATSREAVLDTFTLLPGLGEALKPYLNDVMSALIRVIAEDVEANALAAMHVFMELHKVFRGAVEASVQPFIDFVLKLLESFPTLVQKMSAPTTSSVKLIIECPVMVVLLFQLHRKFINENILKFVPLIMKILEISLDPPAFTPEMGKPIDDLSVLGSAELGRSPLRQQYCDFIQAKVKVLSYLAYVSRSFSSALKAHQNAIPRFVIDILRNCPPESASARKVEFYTGKG